MNITAAREEVRLTAIISPPVFPSPSHVLRGYRDQSVYIPRENVNHIIHLKLILIYVQQLPFMNVHSPCSYILYKVKSSLFSTGSSDGETERRGGIKE